MYMHSNIVSEEVRRFLLKQSISHFC